MKNRIEYLDGLRGLAILLVFLFHAYVRWPELVPYGHSYAEVPPFKYGWLGVELFFMISGFVILMTLEKCANSKEFIYRRWLRLFPAMLICSLLIFVTATYFHERPAGVPTLRNMVPGLTFIEPLWWEKVIRHPMDSIEGAFWSLYVEFKFYFFAALIYYWRGRTFLFGALMGAFVVAIFCKEAEKYVGGPPFRLLNHGINTFSFVYFGWFASGAAFYVYSQLKSLRWFLLAVSAAILSSIFVGDMHWQSFIAASLVSLLFAGALISLTIQRILNNRIFQFFGFVSYPLYLIHENAMVSIIVKLGHKMPRLPSIWYPLIPLAVLSAVAYVVARYLEPYVKGLIVKGKLHVTKFKLGLSQ